MCNCINVEFGSYDNQVSLKRPNHMSDVFTGGSESDVLSIDSCLKDEIEFLWSHGIITTGCCCGHNKGDSFKYIGVHESCIDKMYSLGYVNQPNLIKGEEHRMDGFKPKSI